MEYVRFSLNLLSLELASSKYFFQLNNIFSKITQHSSYSLILIKTDPRPVVLFRPWYCSSANFTFPFKLKSMNNPSFTARLTMTEIFDVIILRSCWLKSLYWCSLRKMGVFVVVVLKEENGRIQCKLLKYLLFVKDNVIYKLLHVPNDFYNILWLLFLFVMKNVKCIFVTFQF